jgi:hypothetical protein
MVRYTDATDRSVATNKYSESKGLDMCHKLLHRLGYHTAFNTQRLYPSDCQDSEATPCSLEISDGLCFKWSLIIVCS